MAGHKVVIKLLNGDIIKGWLENFNPNRENFYIIPLKEYSEKEILEFSIKNIKSVFFVKDFIGNKDYQKVRTFAHARRDTPTQKRIIIHFTDGEKFYGTTYGYNPNKTGFFIYPADSKDNNIRVFAINTAIEKVEFPDNI